MQPEIKYLPVLQEKIEKICTMETRKIIARMTISSSSRYNMSLRRDCFLCRDCREDTAQR